MNSPDFALQTANMGLMPKWDSIKVGISGTDGASIAVLRIKENERVVFDLMESKDCEIIWLDGNFGVNDGCYFGSASFQRDPQIGNAGNYHLDFCTGKFSTAPVPSLLPSLRLVKIFNFKFNLNDHIQMNLWCHVRILSDHVQAVLIVSNVTKTQFLNIKGAKHGIVLLLTK